MEKLYREKQEGDPKAVRMEIMEGSGSESSRSGSRKQRTFQKSTEGDKKQTSEDRDRKSQSKKDDRDDSEGSS